MAFTWIRGQQKNTAERPQSDDDRASALSAIRLRIEDGLLMAFGPEGDPVPPALLRTACTDSAVDGPIMEDGTVVDRRKVLAVMDAQQRGPVADHASDGWIEAMLGLRGRFEATPDDLLKSEPEDDLPPLPDAAPAAGAASSIPLAFDETERAAMAEADALLVRGLTGDMQLSAGRYDPTIDSWVLRPGDVSGLSVHRMDAGSEEIELEVTAILTDGRGRRQLITRKRIAFPG